MKKLIVLVVCGFMSVTAYAQSKPPAATQNTIQTTGPVTSDTVISVGTLGGQVLAWVASLFTTSVGLLLTAWLSRLFAQAGVEITDAMRARLQEIVINGINIGAATAAKDLAGKGQVEIKNKAVQTAIEYVQKHGADELKRIGFDPNSNMAIDAIKARIETAIVDANTPTSKVLDPPPSSFVGNAGSAGRVS